ncbi:phospholipase D family protein [Sulfitobacter sabulilitoris]|nr:phospholipase D family protein [Sulfitobacter sabulilitoris]
MGRGASQVDEVTFLITASEAFVALEHAFLDATTEIRACFRIFDLTTHLQSDRGKAVGSDWFDLIADTLRRGVEISFVLTDFDPVAIGKMHAATWQSVRLMHAAAEASGRPDLLRCTGKIHPASVGALPRMMLALKSRPMLREQLDTLNGMSLAKRARAWRLRPGLHPLVRERDGKLLMKRFLIPELQPVTHHQKLAVFDRKLLYIGGLDLNDRRYDTPEHNQPPAQTWHDTQVMVTGPVAQVAHDHLAEFLDTVAGRTAAKPAPGLLRTMSRPRVFNVARISPRTVVSELAQAHYDLVGRAKKLIYLETQFFRDRKLANRLVDAVKANPDLHLLVVLPGAPEEIAFDNSKGADQQYGEYLQARYVTRVAKAFGSQAFFATPVKPQNGGSGRAAVRGAPLIYVHAKLSVFDDTDAIISSANLNGRSFRWDTEAGLWLDRPKDVSAIRERCFRHWMPQDADVACFAPETAVAGWRARAFENARLPPVSRKGFLLPYPIRPAKRFGRNLPGMPEDIV